MKRTYAVAACVAAVMAFGTNAALAGEVTGSGANADQNQGKSWCSFSGLNDDPNAPIEPVGGPNTPNGPGGTSQSYGQNVRYGFEDPSSDKLSGPGTMCNPNRTFLPPNPNRTK